MVCLNLLQAILGDHFCSVTMYISMSVLKLQIGGLSCPWVYDGHTGLVIPRARNETVLYQPGPASRKQSSAQMTQEPLLNGLFVEMWEC